MNELVVLKSPLSVNFEVTPICNLHCEFCFNAKKECRNLSHPPLSRVKAILDELARAEVFEVRLFGGEFFTYPQWREVLEYADQLDFFLSFVSNGTYLTLKVVQKLKQHRVIGGAISLHGPKNVYEKICGVKNTFELVISGIRACIENNMEISILYTLTKENYFLVFDTIKWLKDHKIDINEVNVGRLTPYGKAKDNWERTKLSFSNYMAVFTQLERIRTELNVLANFGDAFPLCMLSPKYHDFVIGCWQGTGFGHIDHKGNIRSCSITQGSYGNILKTPLTEIWTNRLAHFRSLTWLPEKCQNCNNFCGGGCSASQYNGGMYAPDEFIVEEESCNES